MNTFTIRVYGVLVNKDLEVLVSDEREGGLEFTKFPGDGLEYGEGLLDGLKREFLEECGARIEILRHINTTDFLVQSVFNNKQVIGVHYHVGHISPLHGPLSSRRFGFEADEFLVQVSQWVAISRFQADDLTLDMDSASWKTFLSIISHDLDF